jgi:hypothetical protein
MLGLGLIALTLSLIEMVNQGDPTIWQRIKRQVFLPCPKGLAYAVQE